MIRGSASPWATSRSATRSASASSPSTTASASDQIASSEVSAIIASRSSLPTRPPSTGPEGEPLELGAQAHRAGSEALDQQPRRVRSQVEAELLGLGDQLLGQLPLPRRLEEEDLAPRALHRLRERGRRLSVGDQGDRRLGRKVREGLGDLLGVLLPPCVDAVDEQVAAGRDQGEIAASETSMASASGARRPSPASNSSSAPGPPSRSARSRSRAPGPGDLRLVGAGDQVRGLDLGHAPSVFDGSGFDSPAPASTSISTSPASPVVERSCTPCSLSSPRVSGVG